MENNAVNKDATPFKISSIKIKDENHWGLFRATCSQEYVDFYKDFIYNHGTEKNFIKADSAFGEICRFLKSEYAKRGNEEKAEKIINELVRLLNNNLQYCNLIESNQVENFPMPNLEYFDEIKNYMMQNKNANDPEVNKMKFKYIQDFCNGITSLSNAVENCVTQGGPSAQ